MSQCTDKYLISLAEICMTKHAHHGPRTHAKQHTNGGSGGNIQSVQMIRVFACVGGGGGEGRCRKLDTVHPFIISPLQLI